MKTIYESNDEFIEYVKSKKDDLQRLQNVKEGRMLKLSERNILEFLRENMIFYIDKNHGDEPELYFYDYDSKLYTASTTLLLDAFSVISGFIPSTGKCNSMCQLLLSDTKYSYPARKKDINELPAANGLYNQLTEEFREYGPDVFITSTIDTNYVKDAKHPQLPYNINLIDLIGKIANYNEDRQLGLLQVMKQSCMKQNLDQSFIMFIGRSGRGKSTMSSIIQNIIGFNHVCNATINQLQKDEFIVQLSNKHVMIGDDINENTIIKDIAFLKTLTGGGRIIANRKYMSAISFNYEGVLIQNSPQILTINDSGGQLGRRLKPYAFEHDFTKDSNRIPEHELSEILNRKDVREYYLSYIMNHDNVPYLNQFIGWDQQLLKDIKEANDPFEDFYDYLENNTLLLQSDKIPVKLLRALYLDISDTPIDQKNVISLVSFQNRIRDVMISHGFIKTAKKTRQLNFANHFKSIDDELDLDLNKKENRSIYKHEGLIGDWVYKCLEDNERSIYYEIE